MQLATEPYGEMVCRYVPDRNGSQVVLRSDGSVKFVNEGVAEKDSIMKADIFRRSTSGLVYKIVMAGRTDTFEVSFRTLRGTQRLSSGNGGTDRVFDLSCVR